MILDFRKCILLSTVFTDLLFSLSYSRLVVNRFFMKLFKMSDINVVKHCQREFNFGVPRDILAIRCE